MKRLFLKLGLVAVGVAGFFGYDQYDRAYNYEQVVAEVTTVDEVCHLTKKEGKTRYVTDAGPCDIVEEINRTHPEYLDYKLVRTTDVQYRYQSPADGNTYSGSHKQRKHEDGTPIAQGEGLTVLAHKAEPETTKKF